MKKNNQKSKLFVLTFSLLLTMLFCVSCLKTVSPETQATSAEQAGAMRELLNVSVDTSCLRLSQAKLINSSTGYNGNIDVEIPFASFILSNETALSTNVRSGVTRVARLKILINTAAENTALLARRDLQNVVMSLDEADLPALVLTDVFSGTNYLQSKVQQIPTPTEITNPIYIFKRNYLREFKKKLTSVGADTAFSNIVSEYNSIETLTDLDTTNAQWKEFSSEKAILGIFVRMKNTEKDVRQKPGSHITVLLKKVFG